MIVVKTAAKKSLAVALALALCASAPMNAWSQIYGASSRMRTAGGPIGVSGAGTQVKPAAIAVDLPSFSLDASAREIVSVAATAAPLAVETHPVIGFINELLAKGIVLPDTLSTAQDAATLLAAAQAMPAGSASRHMLEMAAAISGANGSLGTDMIWDGSNALQGKSEATQDAATHAVKKVRKAKPKDFEVPVEDLHYKPALSQIPDDTALIAELDTHVVGQDAALEAIRFGLKMPGSQYNLFVAGPAGSGRKTALRQLLPEVAANMSTPGDRVAVTNFKDKANPLMLDLPAGRAPLFVKAVRDFVETLKISLPETLESDVSKELPEKILTQVREASAKREKDFQDEIKAINLADGKFTVKFFAEPADKGNVMISLKIMYKGKVVTAENAKKDAYTRDEIAAAAKERDQKFPVVVEKYKAMIAQDNKEMKSAQEKIGTLETKIAEVVIVQAGQRLRAAITPEAEVSPEMAELRAKSAKWSADFKARVAAVDVDGFGIQFVSNKEGVHVVYTMGGEALTEAKLAEAMKEGMTKNRFTEIQKDLSKKAQNLATEYKEKAKEFGQAHEALAKVQPPKTPEQLAVVSYVEELLKFASSHYRIFMGKIAASSAKDAGMDVPGPKPMDASDFFKASILSSNGGRKGAPFMFLENPTLDAVFGQIDDGKRSMMLPGVGGVEIDAPGGPTLIAGAISQVEGGILAMDLMDVLRARACIRL